MLYILPYSLLTTSNSFGWVIGLKAASIAGGFRLGFEVSTVKANIVDTAQRIYFLSSFPKMAVIFSVHICSVRTFYSSPSSMNLPVIQAEAPIVEGRILLHHDLKVVASSVFSEESATLSFKRKVAMRLLPCLFFGTGFRGKPFVFSS